MEFFLAGVAILSAVVTYGASCPTECTCNYNSTGAYVYCNNKNMGYIPTNLPNTTYSLDLKYNNIPDLNVSLCNILPNLRELYMDYNKIKTIEENSFVNLTNLRELTLVNNEISVIKKNAFVNLTGLWNLYLFNNNITVLDPQMTRSMPNLHQLDLYYNSITVLDPQMTRSMPYVFYLGLHHNKIMTIEENSFVNLPYLRELYLPNNEISVIKENAFVNLPQLRVLHLYNNNITVLDPKMTRSMPNLYELRLQNNALTVITARLFYDMNNLYEINFSGNNIRFIESEAFGKNPSLQYLYLTSNPLTCNCSILPFWTWLTTRPSLGASAKCSNGTYVTDITSSDLDKCNDISAVTESLKRLTTVSVDNNTVHDIVGSVKNLTSDPTILTRIDIISVADVLINVSKLPSIDERVLADIFDIIDSVINVNVSTLTKAQDIGSATNRLLEVVNAVSTSLDIGKKTVARFLRDNILMDVYDVSNMKSPVIGIQIDTGEFEALSNSTVKTIMSAQDVELNTSDAAIILPVELLRGMNKSTRVALNVYRNWNLFAERSDIKQYDPNSRIVAASIIQDGRPVRFLGQYKVKTLFYPRMERSNIVCGYWDYNLHEKSGGWATDGCVLNRAEFGRYVCICDHLTNFAVLVNVGGQDTLVDSLALKTISYIGLILSIIGLSFTVLSFILLKHLRKGRGQQTLVNLAFSLLCFLIVFISGIEQTHDFYSCIAIAVLLHYFILVAFMWMLIEGILQYLRFVKVLGTYIPRFILKTAAPAWGVPLIPVIIVLTLDHKLYHGGNKACWMSLSAFYYSFAVPVCVIVLANIIIFIMILKNLVGRPKGLTSNQSKKNRATMNLRAALSVLVLLGLTWIFGFFTIEGASVVFQYIFTILNVFQGFLIFVLFTAGDKQVRQGWKQLCCRQKPREIYLKAGTSSNENKNNIRTDNRNNNTELTEIDFSMDN